MTAPLPLQRMASLLSACALALATAAGGAAETPTADTRATMVVRPSGHGWTWPLEPQPVVLRQFDPPRRPWLSGHRGVDLGGTRGAEVRSPQGGTVVFSGWVVDRPVVTIDHGGGLRSSFEPVTGVSPVGAHVAKGEPVGTVALGDTRHCAPDDCLHWGVRSGEEYVDPLAFIEDRRPSVLLPWG